MQGLFIQYIFLIMIILALVMIANRLRVAYPIVLVLGGLLLSVTSAFSRITIDPEYVFFIFLPPLLYEAAWQVSWKEFWKWRRVITSFAFPIVIITSCVIAFASQTLIPGFTWALGFLLGGIISPPDAVSATTIMRQVKVPKSLMSIIAGESLLNDASSLIVFRFAVVAVATSQFDFGKAATSFFVVIVMGSLIGLAIGAIFYAIHRLMPTTANVETVLTLLTPYCMYYAAEHFNFSGVLAVVSGGLLLSSKRQIMLDFQSRMEAINVWTNVVFVMNGLVFMLIGLQLPSIISQLGETSLTNAIWYGVVISLILIFTRLACTFGAAIFTRIMSNFITVADANPGWKEPLISGWAGMRGVVSLAAALSVPLIVSGGQPFPYRNLILFITFIVILFTLVLQGLTLPWLIHKVKLEDKFSNMPEQQQETGIQKKLAQVSLTFLQNKYGNGEIQNEHLDNLFTRLQLELKVHQQNFYSSEGQTEDSLTSYRRIYLELLEEQRKLLEGMNRRTEIDEELVRKYLSLIDLEEFKIREKLI